MSTTLIKLSRLGFNFQFSVDTAAYQQAVRDNEYRWDIKHAISQNSHSEYLGPGGESLKLAGVIYPFYITNEKSKNKYRVMEELRQEAETGNPLLLTDSIGNTNRYYAITRLSETQTHHDANGIARKIEFDIELTKVTPVGS